MYNYREEIKADVLQYINEEINFAEFDDLDELEQHLNDELWTADSVTGNASGSYFFNRWNAEEAIAHNWGLLEEALQVAEAIQKLAEKPDNMRNFVSYLTYFFPAWLEKFANTPETLAYELRAFADMEI